MDRLSANRRSENMSRIRSEGTLPEMFVRRLAHSLGYRFRLHAKHLPGKPDLVFASRRRVIFVHGCFWHQHEGCREGRIPKTRTEYWKPKLLHNIERDRLHLASLSAAGWQALTIWECELDDAGLSKRIKSFLSAGATPHRKTTTPKTPAKSRVKPATPVKTT